eukprot:4321498-Karenia_brevis.AAC.1
MWLGRISSGELPQLVKSWPKPDISLTSVAFLEEVPGEISNEDITVPGKGDLYQEETAPRHHHQATFSKFKMSITSKRRK